MTSRNKVKEKDVENFFNLSGAAMNRTRYPSPVPGSITDSKTELHIDLFNFDEPKFEDSKYVLTSPRSLEACSRLAVKPVELLYKPLIEFQDELIPQGFSLRTIYEIYDAQEHERLNKLQLCREEREKIITEDRNLGTDSSGPVILKSPHQPPKPVTLTKKSSVRERLMSDGDCVESDDNNMIRDKGSLQRSRTAWMTSVGHRRITQDEINQRAKEIYEQAEKLRRKNLMKVKRKRRARSAPSREGHTHRRPVSAQGTRRKKQECREQLRSVDKNVNRGSQESVTDVSSVTSSRVSRPWIRDPLSDVKPISNPVLRQKLQNLNTNTKQLSSKSPRSSVDGVQSARSSAPLLRTSDQKLLQLMINKREAEQKRQQEREALRRKWDEERRKETLARNSAENKRRTQSEKKRASSSSSCIHKCNGNTSCNCGRDHNRQVSTPSHTPKQTLSHYGVHSPTENDHCQRSWVMASQKRNELLKKQMQEKKMRELERRKSVEKRLEEQRRAEEEHQRKLKEKQQQDLEKAEMVRQSQEQQKELTRRLKIFQAQQRYKERTEQLKRESMEDLVAMKASIELQDHLIQGKHKEIIGKKEREAKRRSLDLDNRLRQSKENKQKLDEELQQWRQELLLYSQQQERRAEELARQRVLEKARRANEERRAKQKLQKENMKKLLSAEEEWKAEVEATIALKDSKTKTILQEKEEIIQQSRAMAHTAQLLREELRHHYSLNDLDKLNQQAELEARLSLKTLPSAASSMARVNTDL